MPGRRYDRPPKDVQKRIDWVLKRYHSRLLEPQLKVPVNVETLLVFGPTNKDGEQTGPAIAGRTGQGAYGCIRVTRLEERVGGRGDAIMHLDGDDWKSWGTKTLDAIIDHELTHLEIAIDKKVGVPVYDDAGRPKLKLRPHDFEVGWFDEVAERHPDFAIETKQAAILARQRQLYFPGFEFIEEVARKAG